MTDHLLAAVVDLLAGANWQRGGGKGRKPKPVKRPGESGPVRHGAKPTGLSNEEVKQALARAAGRA